MIKNEVIIILCTFLCFIIIFMALTYLSNKNLPKHHKKKKRKKNEDKIEECDSCCRGSSSNIDDKICCGLKKNKCRVNRECTWLDTPRCFKQAQEDSILSVIQKIKALKGLIKLGSHAKNLLSTETGLGKFTVLLSGLPFTWSIESNIDHMNVAGPSSGCTYYICALSPGMKIRILPGEEANTILPDSTKDIYYTGLQFYTEDGNPYIMGDVKDYWTPNGPTPTNALEVQAPANQILITCFRIYTTLDIFEHQYLYLPKIEKLVNRNWDANTHMFCPLVINYEGWFPNTRSAYCVYVPPIDGITTISGRLPKRQNGIVYVDISLINLFNSSTVVGYNPKDLGNFGEEDFKIEIPTVNPESPYTTPNAKYIINIRLIDTINNFADTLAQYLTEGIDGAKLNITTLAGNDIPTIVDSS